MRPKWQREGYKTRRQYEDARAVRNGFANYAEYQRLRKDEDYVRAIEKQAAIQGKSAASLRRLDSWFSQRTAELGEDTMVDLLGTIGPDGRPRGTLDWEAFWSIMSPTGELADEEYEDAKNRLFTSEGTTVVL